MLSKPTGKCRECGRDESNDLLSESASDDLLCDDGYAYRSIEEYEEIVGTKVNDAFRIGWNMARVTMKQLRDL